MFRSFLRSAARAAVASTALALIAGSLALAPNTASANPAGTGLVITEAYFNGGSAGATYTHKFVEIYNPTDAAIPLTGLSLQYRSATGTGTASTAAALAGSLAAGDYYVVQGGSNGANGVAVPNVDQIALGINAAGAGGTLFVATGTTTINPGVGNVTTQVDLLGYGTSNTREGANPAAAASVTTSAQRDADGTDTDVNSADFESTEPTPGAPKAVVEPPGEFEGPIAEIQGTGDVSPHVGDIATTTGVVIAKYPAGGLNGFYIQTGGTGGATDATPGASDGVFVFGPGVDESTLDLGDSVEVTGEVSEFNGLTEITAQTQADVVELATPLAPVTPLAAAYPTTAETREDHEGELLAPTNRFTVTNTFNTNAFAEIGLATGTTPLIQPTDVVDAQTGDVAGVTADNAARAVALDDGASINFLTNNSPNQDVPLPWLSTSNPIRVGAGVTFNSPVVLDFRNNAWKFQPTQQVTDSGANVATFENTRPANLVPQEVGGDLKLATFNVLNYFNTTGEQFVANGGTCTYFVDRDGNRIANNNCTPDGPRGAATTVSFQRQQQKIVNAINTMDADIVSLEEIENSVKLLTETDRDDALNDLVTALNAAAGETRWAFAPTPPPAELPEVAEQDVIRNAFIYDPATVELVGESDVLTGSAAFANAREPLAQAFKASGGADEDAFAVIVNHFKSKGSGVNDGTGQGNANPDRIAQAEGLSAFADEFASSRGTEAVFLTGDFNSYSKEDPMQVLYADGYTKLESDTAGETSYSFSGLSGSLDHVLANAAALDLVTGVDIWETNANESVAFQYSRFNYNITQFFEGDNPFAASDHNPEIVGLDVADVVAIEEIQILGTNDFHGRIQNNSSNGEAGAAVLAGAVKQLRAQNPSTVFAAAGDLIGASTFESFIAQDKPTIDALNEAGLEVSAVGNHEFDQGYDDLVNRVMAPYDETTNPYGGAEWEYLGANVRFRDGGGPALPESWIQDFGDVEVGFVGAVTEHLDELVSPAGIEDIEVTSVVAAANTTADELRADGADIVVLLVHEGATTTSIASATDPTSDFGQIVLGVDEDIDAIVSGHTHLAYNHAIPVQQWIDEGRPVTTRPVVSAGQYGTNLNQLLYDVDTTTGQLLGVEQNILALKSGQTANYPSDPATAQIVADAVAAAEVLGAEPLGEIGGPFNRAKLANGTTENRGGESTLGNLVAEVQRWATASATTGSAQIAFMNPGGLRADLVGTVADGYPETVTFKQAANVQPFANTLVNMDLTGAQVKQALEQQWQPAGSSRPFLRLGISEGFTYTYDPNAAAGSRITDMWLDGEDIDPAATYSVTVNSFLASGGDNFGVFNAGTGKQDTGQTDLEAMVDYMAENSPVSVDYTQRSVGVSFPAGAPDEYPQGGDVSFNLSSLAFSTPPDLKDATVEVSLDGTSLGTFPVDNTIGTAVFDEYGTAAVTVTLPQNSPPGEAVLTVTGTTTGTETMVPITVFAPEPLPSSITATAEDMVYGTDGEVVATVTPAAATGEVEVFDGETSLGSAPVTAGVANITIDGTALEIGSHVLDVRYSGGPGFEPSETTVRIDVAKATPTMTISRSPAEVAVKSGKVTLTVDVSAEGYEPGGVVGAYVTGNLVGLGTVSPEGVAEFEVGPFRKRGTVTIDIVYFGDEHTLGAEGTTSVTVVKKKPEG